jgi:hypothetical protein
MPMGYLDGKAEPSRPPRPHRPAPADAPGFLLSYNLAGPIGVGLLAFAVSRILSTQIRTAQLASATRSANLLVSAAFGRRLTGGKQLKIAQLRALDQATLAARCTAVLAGVGVWNPAGRIICATDHRLIGKTIVRPAEVGVCDLGPDGARRGQWHAVADRPTALATQESSARIPSPAGRHSCPGVRTHSADSPRSP